MSAQSRYLLLAGRRHVAVRVQSQHRCEQTTVVGTFATSRQKQFDRVENTFLIADEGQVIVIGSASEIPWRIQIRC